MLWLIALLVLNRIVYANILPIIFFHAGFDEDAYEENLLDPALSELVIETQTGTLYGWEWGSDSDTVVLYYGGDASDSNRWLRSLSETERMTTFGGTKLLTADYPAFGRSEGSINEQSFYAAADALYEYAKQKYPAARLVAIGYSLGCAAVLHVASEKKLDGAVIVAPMYDGTNMYFPRDSMLHAYFAPTASVKLDNDAVAEKVEERILVIASTGDGMTKLADIEALCALFATPPQLTVLDGVGHGDYWETEQTQTAVGEFLRSVSE